MTNQTIAKEETFTTCPAPYSLYSISKSGHVKHDGHTLKPFLNNSGYELIRVKKDDGSHSTVPLHRLLGLTFIPNPAGLSDIDHIDSDRLNNSLDNLRWISHRQNLQRRQNNGGCYLGVICKNDDGNILGRFESINQASVEMGVNPSSVRAILNGWQKSTRSGYVFVFSNKN